MRRFLRISAVLLVSISSRAGGAEIAVGEPVRVNGMEIAAVYLQPVLMDPGLPGMEAADIHLEADVHAVEGNAQGFGAGEWVPYLGITFHIRKVGEEWSTIGNLRPMVASDGPHYAANVALAGPGKYRLDYHLTPPAYQGFGRHIDKETGVEAWWEPVDLSWEFTYVGTGKKGGY